MLMAPDNGMIDCSLGDDGVPTNGDTCTVTCNEGFRLRGDATRRCRAEQMRWLGDEARCIPGVNEMYNFCIVHLIFNNYFKKTSALYMQNIYSYC